MIQEIPITPTHNYELTVNVQLFETNRLMKIIQHYNKTAGYWVVTIVDPTTEEILIDSLPLVTGKIYTESLNIIRALGYLLIGNIYLQPRVSIPTSDFPNETNLETDFQFIWADE